ncbi:MAG TPA: hypothetical protein ENJ69_00370, partial [Bacteroidetes bacterium]|nr:hypothetical protein [Bacteroidota bacterium]
MKKFFPITLALLWLAIAGCTSGKHKSASQTKENPSVAVTFARGFAVFHQNGKQRVVVYNPWLKGKKILASFVLVKSHPRKGEIKVPLDSAAVFSATQLNALELLGLLNKVTGISEARFISNKQV